MKHGAFKDRVWLSSPTMHGEEIEYIRQAYNSNWMSTVGANINEVEILVSKLVGCRYAVALSSGTAALHLAIKAAGVKKGDYVFCTDMTFAATANPILYENAIPVFVDAEYETWNMDPNALEKAFELYPQTKVIVVANLYGTPAKLDEICRIADRHGAVIVEDAAESLGATFCGKQTGSFGKYNAISFNGNKIITGSTGGMFLTDDLNAANRVKKWSTQSRENTNWYQHNEIGYNYRMSNLVAGVVRGQLPYLDKHISQKKAIYERYREGFKNLPVSMNPHIENTNPNYWLSCIAVNENSMCEQKRSENDVIFTSSPGKTCPSEILEALESYNAEGRPVWKPMHLQPMYKDYPFVKAEKKDVGADLFNRGICLPSDNKMTPEEQDRIIEIVKDCFR